MDKVEHFEIPADDVPRALRFYKTVFGWESNPVPGIQYERLLTIRVTPEQVLQRPFEVNGGITKRSEIVPHPVVTISVTHMDDALKKIEKEGGEVVQGKTEFGDRGYTAFFKDSEGNLMGLWQIRARI
jgi:uncharacterized protein